MIKYESPYDMPYNITHDSKYYFDAFRREVARGECSTVEEKRKIAIASFELFHNYIETKETVFKNINKRIEKNQEIEL